MPSRTQPPEVEDIFADSDSVQSPPARPSQKTPLSVAAQSTQPSPAARPARTRHSKPWPLKRTLLLIGIPVMVVLIGGIVIVIDPFGMSSDTSSSDTNAVVAIPTTNATNQTTEVTPSESVAPVQADGDDQDGDGLSDSEEKKLGTDPTNPDTDRDQLFDQDEVNVYKTNPRNPDTDGDGNNDGVEVANGYDPNGPGLLRDINSAINDLRNSNE